MYNRGPPNNKQGFGLVKLKLTLDGLNGETPMALMLLSLLPLYVVFKSVFTHGVRVETCESLSTSLASLASSESSDSPQTEDQILERISTMTGVRSLGPVLGTWTNDLAGLDRRRFGVIPDLSVPRSARRELLS